MKDPRFEVHTVPATLRQESLGLIVGQIWISVGSSEFPETGWDDFPVALIGGWLDKLSPVYGGMRSSCKCCFMDGPYQWILRVTDRPGLCRLSLLYQDEPILSVDEIRMARVIQEVRDAGVVIMQKCLQEEWVHPDIKYLHRQLAALDGKAV